MRIRLRAVRSERSQEEIAAVGRISRDCGVGITFHAPGDHIGLFTDYPDIRLGMMEHFKKIIDVAGALDSHHITFHPLAPPSFRSADTRTNDLERRYFDYYKQIFAENVEELQRVSTGPLVCIENHRLGSVTMAALSELFDHENRIALTLDIPKSMQAHNEPDEAQLAFFRKHADRIQEVHLHDRNREFSHLVPGDGGIDFDAFREVLTANNAWVTIEVRPVHMAVKAKEWLQRAERSLTGQSSRILIHNN